MEYYDIFMLFYIGNNYIMGYVDYKFNIYFWFVIIKNVLKYMIKVL